GRKVGRWGWWWWWCGAWGGGRARGEPVRRENRGDALAAALESGRPRGRMSRDIFAEVGMQPSLFPEAGFTGYRSGQDASVNWDRPADVGRLEARYVRRCADYFVVYLSSQTGCAQACRMCHLTATGQTHLRDATFRELIEQAQTALDHY